MLKENMLALDSSSEVNVLDYVSKFRERLHKACSMAKDSLASAQKKMKCQFDRKSVQRAFAEGDQVLVLLPIAGSALSARFSGPYEVLRKLSDTDYVIRTVGYQSESDNLRFGQIGVRTTKRAKFHRGAPRLQQDAINQIPSSSPTEENLTNKPLSQNSLQH